MSVFLAILQTISSIPKIANIVKQVIASYLAWLDAKEVERIQHAAVLLRSAKTQKEKQDALEKWVNASH